MICSARETDATCLIGACVFICVLPSRLTMENPSALLAALRRWSIIAEGERCSLYTNTTRFRDRPKRSQHETCQASPHPRSRIGLPYHYLGHPRLGAAEGGKRHDL